MFPFVTLCYTFIKFLIYTLLPISVKTQVYTISFLKYTPFYPQLYTIYFTPFTLHRPVYTLLSHSPDTPSYRLKSRCIRPPQRQSGANNLLKTSVCADGSQHLHETNRISSCYTKSLRIFFEGIFIFLCIFGVFFLSKTAYGRRQLSQPMRIVGRTQFRRGCVTYLYKKKTPPPRPPPRGF